MPFGGLINRGRGITKHVYLPGENDIQLKNGAWYCSYSSSYTVRRAIDYVDLSKHAPTTIRAQPVHVLDAFDDPLEYYDLDNNHVANGDESEDELERRLVGRFLRYVKFEMKLRSSSTLDTTALP